MSQTVRQSELFAGAEWEVIYRAFSQINFNASDPVSINRALRDYIAANYPEDFSDWIESSEFIAIIDLLSWLAGTLAFKTDINARENFMEVAEARESILRLARFLSYNPRRTQSAKGLLKIQSMRTDDDVLDALGNNLSNRTIVWNDPNDPDWFEKMVLILNDGFETSHQFGIPLKAGSVAGVRTQLYRLNSVFGDQSLGFTTPVSGLSMPFEAINLDFNDVEGFTERAPDPNNAFHLVYRSDGNGNASAQTGFFIGFKQGQMRSRLFNIPNRIENRIIDIDEDNINQSDVWVQSVNDGEQLLSQWEKVPVVFSDNVTGYNTTYNTIPTAVRDIYSVVTRDNDQISLRFGDGRFGSAPFGNLKVWYRVSNGLQYQIKPQEMVSIPLSLSYINKRGVRKTLTITLSLEESVTNAAARETDDEIRRRAPQVYATQNRMVSGEDYNILPLASNVATKIKAVARVYSGHSRFIDLNDPTGTYQNTTVFGDDGILYKELATSYIEVPLTDNKTPDELLSLSIEPLLARAEMVNYMRDYNLRSALDGYTDVDGDMMWFPVSGATGYVTHDSRHLRPGAMLQIEHQGRRWWVGAVSMSNSVTVIPAVGQPGPVVLTEPVPAAARIITVLPRYAFSLTDSIKTLIRQQLQSTLSFTIWYDFNAEIGVDNWSVRAPGALMSPPLTQDTAIKLLSAEYLSGGIWRFSAQGIRYFFESLKHVQFFFDGNRAVDTNAAARQDMIRILKINPDLASGRALDRDYDWAIDRMVVAADGRSDPKRISLRMEDSNKDGAPDNPDTYLTLVPQEIKNNFLFWKRLDDGTYEPCYDVVVFEDETDRLRSIDLEYGSVAFQIFGGRNETFYVYNRTGWDAAHHSYRFGRGRGPNVAKRWIDSTGVELSAPVGEPMYFQWKHYAPTDRRIDPAKSNLIDIFVLSKEYDFLVRQWIAGGALPEDEPTVPSEFQLRAALSEFETYKMFSDDVVWRPVRYKYLFGANADQELRAQFKVVKLAATTISDGEIKSRVVRAIDNYFNADFWDFGETFYYTELAAYIHQQLAGIIASIVIVPLSQTGTFGDGFEVKCRSDELFISTTQVTDVQIITSNTHTNLRIA